MDGGMGAATLGDGGCVPPVQNSGGRPPEIAISKVFFKELSNFSLYFFQDFQNKVTEIREEIKI